MRYRNDVILGDIFMMRATRANTSDRTRTVKVVQRHRDGKMCTVKDFARDTRHRFRLDPRRGWILIYKNSATTPSIGGWFLERIGH